MSIKPDKWIARMALEKGMIEPFEPAQVRQGISYGLSSYGYDFRLSAQFQLPVQGAGAILDPKNISAMEWGKKEVACFDIPPHSYVLGRSLEYFRIPRNILTLCCGKSTYARIGVFIHVTPFEPEWEGFATLAISNHSALPARIYANEGIGQLIFLQADEVCEVSYADKKGKYQSQAGITGAKV